MTNQHGILWLQLHGAFKMSCACDKCTQHRLSTMYTSTTFNYLRRS
jgi:hypothetical protein